MSPQQSDEWQQTLSFIKPPYIYQLSKVVIRRRIIKTTTTTTMKKVFFICTSAILLQLLLHLLLSRSIVVVTVRSKLLWLSSSSSFINSSSQHAILGSSYRGILVSSFSIKAPMIYQHYQHNNNNKHNKYNVKYQTERYKPNFVWMIRKRLIPVDTSRTSSSSSSSSSSSASQLLTFLNSVYQNGDDEVSIISNNNINDNTNDYDAQLSYTSSSSLLPSSSASLLRSVTFCNLPKHIEPDLICDFLLEIGACSASIVDADYGTIDEQPIFDEPGQPYYYQKQQSYDDNSNNNSKNNRNNSNGNGNSNKKQDSATKSSFTSTTTKRVVWNRCNITAYFPASIDIDCVLDQLSTSSFLRVTNNNNNNHERNNITAVFDDDEKIKQVEMSSVTNYQNYDSNIKVPLHLPYTTSNYRIDIVPDKDWMVHVQQGWEPILVPDTPFVLRFPWHNDTVVQDVIARGNGNSRAKNNNYGTDATIDSTNDNINNNIKAQRVPVDNGNNEVGIGTVQLKLEGGIAFGTGEHPTTQLCLQWLSTVLLNWNSKNDNSSNDVDVDATTTISTNSRNISVLDYGTGSGILGLGACALGQKMIPTDKNIINVQAVGIDIDIDCVRIANLNAIQNGNLPMQSYLPPLVVPKEIDDDDDEAVNDNTNDNKYNNNDDSESRSILMKATMKVATASKPGVSNYTKGVDNSSNTCFSDSNNNNTEIIPNHLLNEQKYDICVANILAVPLTYLAPTLAGMMKSGSLLGLSGILYHQNDIIIESYQPYFDNVTVTKQIEDWILVTGIRK